MIVTAATHHRGFTLIELVVAMIVLAVLAVVAAPVYSAVIARSHHQAAEVSLVAVARTAQALSVAGGRSNLAGTALEDAAADMSASVAAGPGVNADAAMTAVRDVAATEPGTMSYSLGDAAGGHDTVVYQPTIGTGPWAGIAVVTDSGECVGLRFDLTRTTRIVMPAAVTECSGRAALTAPAA
jgi:prepilin-type N-terminal cleavage/methylation domain-containing protein